MYNSGVTQSVDIKQELLRRLNEAEKKAGQSYLTVRSCFKFILDRLLDMLER